ncbi:type III pantothenate kinase [Velocimicrobium porci]|uniref:Type III pantothenate kinase n=1 Tax=Velocimicrobium porci TaxID=2606634 RepID=A0A6L5Y1I4_9FIRM|nr:type III pantothenate kinase [Velocimicrobium porci]MSS64687.1 type III pantothenate kinase [Velocimicrobium porci]
MVLAIDMGNTNIVIGCIDDEKIHFVERMSTDSSKTELEYAISIKNVLELYSIDVKRIEGIIISSVVPPLLNVIRRAAEKVVNKKASVVGPGVKTGLNILMDNPASVGSDMIVSAVAALREYEPPIIFVDMGTATTISVIDKKGNYVGGAILPGVNTSLNALVSNTAQLPRISMEAPRRIIGKNTIECMKSGIVVGNAACIDGMIERIEEELNQKAVVLATGGIASSIIPHCKHEIIIDEALLLKGLKIIFDKNKPENRQ